MSNKVINLNQENFSTVIKDGIVLVDFWAPWCGPCKMQIPILEEVSESVNEKTVITKVNVEENQKLAAEYKIRSLPTLILFKDGKPAQQFLGLQSKEVLSKAIESHV